VARLRPAAAVQLSARGRGNAVGLTSVLDRRQFSIVGQCCGGLGGWVMNAPQRMSSHQLMCTGTTPDGC